jgi:hypothetical protein
MRVVFGQLLLTLLTIGGCDRASDPASAVLPDARTAISGPGVVRGTVMLVGTPPEMGVIKNEPCADHAPKTLREETVVVGKDNGLANTFVYLEGLPRASGRSFAAPVLDQVGCRYTPHVVGVCIGQPLRIRSSDNTMHNVHYAPEKNESRNFGMTQSGDEKQVVFTNAEIIRAKCDVHPWMTAYIGVFDNPAFAVTDRDGKYEISNLPAGKYKLVTWHERYGKLEQDVEVSSAPTKVDLKYSAPSNNQ